jgi:hypothetical protein
MGTRILISGMFYFLDDAVCDALLSDTFLAGRSGSQVLFEFKNVFICNFRVQFGMFIILF